MFIFSFDVACYFFRFLVKLFRATDGTQAAFIAVVCLHQLSLEHRINIFPAWQWWFLLSSPVPVYSALPAHS